MNKGITLISLVRKLIAWALISLLVLPSPSYAWDGAVYGKIIGIDVTDAENYGFRIYLDIGAMCGNANTWAYINKSDANFDAYVSTFTYAFASARNVTVYSTRDVNGYCKMGYILVR